MIRTQNAAALENRAFFLFFFSVVATEKSFSLQLYPFPGGARGTYMNNMDLHSVVYCVSGSRGSAWYNGSTCGGDATAAMGAGRHIGWWGWRAILYGVYNVYLASAGELRLSSLIHLFIPYIHEPHSNKEIIKTFVFLN